MLNKLRKIINVEPFKPGDFSGHRPLHAAGKKEHLKNLFQIKTVRLA